MSKRDAASSSSSSGKRPSKKPASMSPSNGPASEPEEEEEELTMQQERANESGDEEESPTTKATKAFAVSLEDSDEENRSGNEDGDDDDDDIDDDKPKTTAEAGIIHKIYCENFMNHKKLSVDFCRNINFIHGQNGSGKSAILAALQICLGARASVTHRGDKLGGLVRRNPAGGHTATAKVRVTLLNGGTDAYKPDDYGCRITVERVFDAQGKNSYKILDQNDKCVSTKKKDLEEMLDRLNVQVENPVCIMDQENSKEFIKGNERDKYRFFKKATDLERVVTGIQESKSDLESMSAVFTASYNKLRGVAEDAEKAEKTLQDLEAVLKIDEDIKKAQCALFWVDVEAHEANLEVEEDKQTRLAAKEVERRRALEKATEAFANSKSPDDAMAEIERLKSDSDAAKKNVELLNKEVAAAKKPVQNAERDIASAKRRSHDLTSERKRLQKQIADALSEAASSGGADEQAKIAKLDQLQQKYASVEQEIASIRAALEQLQPQGEAAAAEHRARVDDVRRGEHDVKEIEREVRDLQDAQSGGQAMQYGRKVPAINKAIADERGWDHPPVGPLGMHVKLKGPSYQKWAKAVGTHLSSTLRDYVVTSPKDKQLFDKILRKCGALGEHNTILLRPHARYGSPGQTPLETPQGVLTMEQVVQIDDDLAYNALLEARELEGQVLFDSHQEAERQVFGGHKGNLKLKQFVKQSYDPTGSFTSIRNGNKFTIAAKSRQGGFQFGVSAVESLERAHADLKEAKLRLNEAKAMERDAKTNAQAQHQTAKKHEASLQTLEKGQHGRQNEIVSLKEELAEMQDSSAVDTREWEAEEQNIVADLEECSKAIDEAKQAKASAEEIVAQKVHARQEYEKTAKGLGQQMQAAEAELSGVMKARKEGKEGLDKAQRKVDEVVGANKSVNAAVDDARKALTEITEAARAHTIITMGAETEMPVTLGKGKDKEYVKAKIKALKLRKEDGLKALPKGERNVDEARSKAHSARATYNEKVADVKKVEDNIDLLEEDVKKRLKKWKKFRKAISRITNKRFDHTLNQKGQSGELLLDHKAETLSLTVQKDSRDSQSQIGNVKQLSGGERSYATLSLLVALGECVECPFRIMDEFDVFMDAVSRKIALQQLIDEGLQNKHRQFVFITPQDLSSITPRPEVKIIKLQNPDRLVEGQATLA